MTLLLDSSLWIDFTRARSPLALKQFIAPFVLDPAAHLAEPVRFALLRSARPEEVRQLEAQFATLPSLPTPPDLWQQAIALGQACRAIGRTVLSRLRGRGLGEWTAPAAAAAAWLNALSTPPSLIGSPCCLP
jgi:predicted nucleic acid-binding protein